MALAWRDKYRWHFFEFIDIFSHTFNTDAPPAGNAGAGSARCQCQLTIAKCCEL